MNPNSTKKFKATLMKHHEVKKMCISIVTAFGIMFLFHTGVSLAGNTRTSFPGISSKTGISKSDVSKTGISKNKKMVLPSLRLPQTQFIFPKVLEGKAVMHTFAVKNKGTAILKIYKVKPG